MLSSSDMKLAQQLNQHKAVIMKSGGDAYPAYPFGDRRKRPICWVSQDSFKALSSFGGIETVSYTHLRAHETEADLVCRLLLEKKKK